MPNKIKKLAEELTRRSVLRALGAYGIAIWLLAQGAGRSPAGNWHA